MNLQDFIPQIPLLRFAQLPPWAFKGGNIRFAYEYLTIQKLRLKKPNSSLDSPVYSPPWKLKGEAERSEAGGFGRLNIANK